MIFKPVPDSKLARKREERIRKATDREDRDRNRVLFQANSQQPSNRV